MNKSRCRERVKSEDSLLFCVDLDSVVTEISFSDNVILLLLITLVTSFTN